MKNNRPIQLDLLRLRFPVTAIVSILHRVTGLVLFLVLPFVFYYLSSALGSKAQFEQVSHLFSHAPGNIFLWCALMAAIYHVFAGVRHIMMDCGYGESRLAARVTSWLLLGLVGLFALWLGVSLW